ncbi:XapX domain-containing protein [Vibrio fluvialis]|nr:XapX domain-containing protein [Vibrio fluvialis]EKO3521283.1 XapX domain-containing protein [Vibrio fluvialis]EKO3525248.1 XapX domain-containing protein [Vibrio fluvialis]EKO3530806.1 XapX domain-containing protein [Vibrio fluvialis]EKO3545145.1 XapX domain-containing protein [Vibrio fluvialis]
MNYLISLGTGIAVGLVFALLKLPIPAPQGLQGLQGILGAIGIFLGPVLLQLFK